MNNEDGLMNERDELWRNRVKGIVKRIEDFLENDEANGTYELFDAISSIHLNGVAYIFLTEYKGRKTLDDFLDELFSGFRAAVKDISEEIEFVHLKSGNVH